MMTLSVEELSLSKKAKEVLRKSNIKDICSLAIAINTPECLNKCNAENLMELKKVVNDLKVRGYYSNEFVEEYLNSNFVDSLELSVRAKNTLKQMKIINPSELFDINLNDFKKNTKKNIAYEIINFINDKKTDFMYDPNYNYKYPIKKINNLCGNTKIELLLNICNCQKYFDNNIYNIFDLIICTKTPKSLDNKELQEFHYFKNFFSKLANEHLNTSISNSLLLTYVFIPFGLDNKYKIFDLVRIDELISTYVNANYFNSLSLKEQVNIKLYLNWLNSFDISDINEYILDKISLSNKEREIAVLRNSMSLEEIGKKLGLTRERVRQLESKICNKIGTNLAELPFKKILDNEIYYYDCCSETEKILLYVDSVLDKFYTKIKKENMLVFIKSSIIYDVSNMVEENKTTMKQNGYIENNYKCSCEALDIAIGYLKLKRHNINIFSNISKTQMVRYAVRKIGRPIKIYNDIDRKLIINKVYQLFGEKLDDSRGLESLIEKTCVRVDSGTYALEDSIISLTNDTFDKIVEYVKKNVIINARDLFVPFGEILLEHNLLNENILYRYLKENLSDILYFSGVSGVISSNRNDTSWGIVIIKCIKEKGTPISKTEIFEKYPITQAVYDNLPINYDDIIKWGKSELFLKSLIYFPEDIKNKFLQLLSKEKIIKFNDIRALLSYLDKGVIYCNQIIDNYSLFSFLNNTIGDKIIINKKNEVVMIKEEKGKEKVRSYSIAEELTI